MGRTRRLIKLGGVFVLLILTAMTASYLEAKSHKVQYFLYGAPPKPWMVNEIPIMQYTTERGWMNCLVKMNVDADIVFFGNSITAQSDFKMYFPDKNICNLGIGGDNLGGLERRVEMVKAVTPEKVFLMGGINDSKWLTPDTFDVRYEAILKTLHDSLPKAMVYCQSILPVNHIVYDKYADNGKIKQLNEIIKKLAQMYSYEYVDLYSLYEKDGEMPDTLTKDGIHLKPIQYARWADAIRKYVYD